MKFKRRSTINYGVYKDTQRYIIEEACEDIQPAKHPTRQMLIEKVNALEKDPDLYRDYLSSLCLHQSH